MSVGAWDDRHGHLEGIEPYGSPLSYLWAAEWMHGCATVEDWGCGGGGLRPHIDPGAYVGVDGSASPFADVTADLTEYRSNVDGIVLRHVLEHNYQWADILANACASFTKRLAVILFTPLAEQTTVLFTEPDYGDVPVIAFRLEDLLEVCWSLGVAVQHETLRADNAYYGVETILRARR